jgi:membrane associated rhomboid family serine protease
MLLVPIGLEDRPLRRVPWITLGFVLVNVVSFLFTMGIGAASHSDVELLHSLIEKSLEERPHLAIDGRLAGMLGEKRAAELGEARARRSARGLLPGAEQLERDQKEFDTLVEEYVSSIERLPWHRFGFVPAQPLLLSLLTAMFMHGDWLHLLGNMLFLYVGGAYVEDVYGKALYTGSYLLAGIAATLGHYLASPQSSVPIVGASGAIAGIMGIILVRLARAKIRFLFLPIVFLPNVRILLSLPAFVVLPLWLLEQLWYAGQTSVEGGVAWWAHVAGFMFGCVLAAIVRLGRIEERWLGRSQEADEGRRSLDHAAAARQAGDFARAHLDLSRAVSAEPESVDAWREAYELALDERNASEVARILARLLELLPQQDEATRAMSLLDDGRWAEIPNLPPRLYVSIATFLERQGETRRALRCYDDAIRLAPNDGVALRALVRRAEMLAKLGDRAGARRSLNEAQAHPALDDAWRATIDRALAKLGD